MLKNPRRERFAQLLASGKTATDAYVEAGYRPNRFNAATMAREDEIKARVAQINRVAAERAAVTAESLIKKAEAARAAAMEAGQFSAAIAAVKLQAELAGLFVRRKEDVTRPRDRAEIDAEILELLGSKEAGVPPRPH